MGLDQRFAHARAGATRLLIKRIPLLFLFRNASCSRYLVTTS
jgi:hypothetical protein